MKNFMMHVVTLALVLSALIWINYIQDDINRLYSLSFEYAMCDKSFD